MVSIKVKLQKRPGHRGKYDSYIITLPKVILDTAPKIKKSATVELDVNSKGEIIVKPAKT